MSGRLPQLSYRKVAKALQRAGLVLDHATGSHHFFIHPRDPTILVSVPRHSKDIKRGLLYGIIKDAGLTVEQFLALL